MPPMMFKKSNGAYVYDSTDLATIYERMIKYNPDHIIYVTDFRQNLHFEQVFRASELAGFLPYKSLEHAYNGTINGSDGKPFKTRQGNAPKLGELLEEVKETFINMKESNKNMSENDIDIITNSIDSPKIAMSDECWHYTTLLREWMFKNVYIDSPAKLEEKKTARIVCELYKYYTEFLQNQIEPEKIEQIVVDYISGMTDQYAIEKFKELFIPKPIQAINKDEAIFKLIKKNCY